MNYFREEIEFFDGESDITLLCKGFIQEEEQDTEDVPGTSWELDIDVIEIPQKDKYDKIIKNVDITKLVGEVPMEQIRQQLIKKMKK
jgi:hypothetical protein